MSSSPTTTAWSACPERTLVAVLQASDARVAKEAASRADYQSGGLSLDRNKLRPVLAELGVAYVTERDFLAE